VSERRLVTIALFRGNVPGRARYFVVFYGHATVIGQIGGIPVYAWVFSAISCARSPCPFTASWLTCSGRKPVS